MQLLTIVMPEGLLGHFNRVFYPLPQLLVLSLPPLVHVEHTWHIEGSPYAGMAAVTMGLSPMALTSPLAPSGTVQLVPAQRPV